jgi:hypothetical protein
VAKLEPKIIEWTISPTRKLCQGVQSQCSSVRRDAAHSLHKRRVETILHHAVLEVDEFEGWQSEDGPDIVLLVVVDTPEHLQCAEVMGQW